MTYESPYEPLYERIQDLNPGDSDFIGDDEREIIEDMGFSGTLEQVLSELLVTGGRDKITNEVIRVLHPPRIIRAVIDYKVDHNLDGVEDLVLDAIDLALGFYHNDPDIVEQVDDFVQSLKGSEDEGLLSKSVSQKMDQISWASSAPSHSEFSAFELKMRKEEDRPYLFIALAHGGVGPGMDVFLRYCALTGDQESEFYAVRLSTEKCEDYNPQLSSSEKEYLKGFSQTHKVVLFDEDSASGTTMFLAKNYFTYLLGQEPLTIINVDHACITPRLENYHHITQL